MDIFSAISPQELAATLLNIGFLFLLLRKSPLAWPVGIAGSAISMWYFLSDEIRLYSEAALYGYYVLLGFYGWIGWVRNARSQADKQVVIATWGTKRHLVLLSIGLCSAPALGWFMHDQYGGASPYLDAATTVFSVLAGYMQAERVYTSWHAWITINAASVFLYASREAWLFSALATLYVIMSIQGLLRWRKMLKLQQA